MDTYSIGRDIGMISGKVCRLQADRKKDRQDIKKVQADIRLNRRVVLLVAIWATSANGLSNSDEISTIAAALIKKALIGF